jgi:hypothetical protein
VLMVAALAAVLVPTLRGLAGARRRAAARAA